MARLKLGLIGANIGASRSPALHRIAGRLAGLEVTYDLLIPAQLGLDLDATLAKARADGYRGLNITYPFKEMVVSRVSVEDPAIRRLGAVNTVLLDAGGPHGFNTDHSGFMAAFSATFGHADPGVVAIAGTGGVGRAIAFALAGLGAARLRLHDRERAKAKALAATLRAAFPEIAVEVSGSIEAAARGADGLVNCTPLGMVGHEGTAIPKAVIGGQRWAFDAVYTPVDTQFLDDARAAGIPVMSGYELFFHQGINAFKIFTGRDVDRAALRRCLVADDAVTPSG
jgi:shikimate dehydrogenase